MTGAIERESEFKKEKSVEEYRAESALYDYLGNADFKRVLSQIHSAVSQQKLRSLAVISTEQGAGKTFFVSVIALGLASLLKQRVAIIETVAPRKGDQSNSWAPALYPMHMDYIGSLSVAECEMEVSDFQIRDYINAFERDYDLVILDTCAIEAANSYSMDPLIIAQQADAALVILSKNCLGKDKLRRMRSELKRWKVKVLGTVYNAGAV